MCMHLHITVTMPLAVKSAASVVVDDADRRAWANCREAWKNRSGAIDMADVEVVHKRGDNVTMSLKTASMGI